MTRRRRRRRYVAGVGRSRLGRASHSSGQLARRTGVLDGRRLQRQHRARGEAVERLSEITRGRWHRRAPGGRGPLRALLREGEAAERRYGEAIAWLTAAIDRLSRTRVRAEAFAARAEPSSWRPASARKRTTSTAPTTADVAQRV